jgi:hypothetical protein
MSFNIATVFAHLYGRTFATYRELKPELSAVRLVYLRELPPDCGPDGLYEILLANRMVKEVGGVLSICPPPTKEVATRFRMETTTNLANRTCDFSQARSIVVYLVEHGFIEPLEAGGAIMDGMTRRLERGRET